MAKRSKRKKPFHGNASSAASATTTSHPQSLIQAPLSGFLRSILPTVLIAAAASAIFWPVLHGDWLWDDTIDITENPITQSANGLWKIWFEPGSQIDYYPVKASVQWAQWHLWGNDTLGYHVTNLVLHIFNALLVWRLFRKLGLKLAWLGGLIFAVQPVQVESVAWIAELKNTLSMALFLPATIFYLDFDEQRRPRDLMVAVGFFLLAMLTKPTMVMFPIVILLYAWWRRGRIQQTDLKASAPFFIVSLALGLVTLLMAFWFRHLHQQEAGLAQLNSFFSRVALTGLSLGFYLGRAVWPAGLLPIYPQWPVSPPSFLQFLPWPVLGGFLFWFWTQRQSWGRSALFGFGFFLMMLLPFCGLVPASYMTFTWVMDHFLYIPILGLIGLAIAGLEQVEKTATPSVRYAGIGLLVVIVTAMIAESRAYAEKFVSQEVLCTYTLAGNPTAWPAQNNLGLAFFHQGRIDEALAHFQQAAAMNSDSAEIHNNLGMALCQKGQVDEALAQYQKAQELDPNTAQVPNNIGLALAQKGKPDEAIAQFLKALAINPDFIEAHNNLGMVLAQKGRLDEAAVEYRKVLEMAPDQAETHNNLAIVLAQKGEMPEAIAEFEEAVRLKPDYATAQDNLAKARASLNQAGNAK